MQFHHKQGVALIRSCKDLHFKNCLLEVTQALFPSNESLKTKASYNLLAMEYAALQLHCKVDWKRVVTKKASLRLTYDLYDIVDTYVSKNKHRVCLGTVIIAQANDENVKEPSRRLMHHPAVALEAIGVP